MAALNKVFLMGNLTFDPELRRTPSGMAVTDLRMASSRTYLGRDGERKEETLFIDVTVWDRQAETCCQYLKKGSGIHVEGSLKMDTWDDKTTGEKRSKIKVHADRVQFLDRREPSGMSSPDEESASREPAPARRPSPTVEQSRGAGNGPSRGFSNGSPPPASTPAPRRPAPEPEPTDDDEDIPF